MLDGLAIFVFISVANDLWQNQILVLNNESCQCRFENGPQKQNCYSLGRPQQHRAKERERKRERERDR
jgi:hypothetical protein